jgi:hypothetical protein
MILHEGWLDAIAREKQGISFAKAFAEAFGTVLVPGMCLLSTLIDRRWHRVWAARPRNFSAKYPRDLLGTAIHHDEKPRRLSQKEHRYE